MKKRRNVLVTGSSSGIGLRITKAFAKKNYRVIACSRRKDLMEKELSEFKNIHIFSLDLSNPQNIEKFISPIIKDFGSIDILVNNAAVLHSGKIENISVDDFTTSFLTNVVSIFALTKFVLPKMKKNNFGRIINISSGGAINCSPEFSPYSSSKAAINAFTKSVANEIEGTNVKINSMSPGPCKTKMFPDNPLDPDAGIPTALMLASENEKLSNGKFFWMEKEVEVFADVSNIDWSDPNSI